MVYKPKAGDLIFIDTNIESFIIYIVKVSNGLSTHEWLSLDSRESGVATINLTHYDNWHIKKVYTGAIASKLRVLYGV